MNKEKRFNESYEIIESCTLLDNSEVVIGHNKEAPDPYVCWICHNKTDYIWGRYCQSLESAKKHMQIRCQSERQTDQNTRHVPPKGRDSHER